LEAQLLLMKKYKRIEKEKEKERKKEKERDCILGHSESLYAVDEATQFIFPPS